MVLLSGPCAALVLAAEASLSRVPVPGHGVNVAGDALRPGACPSLLCELVICERLDPLRRSRRREGLLDSLLLWRTHPFALLRHCAMDKDSADRYLVVSGQDPAADLHSRDDQKLAWTKGIDPHPVMGGSGVDEDRVSVATLLTSVRDPKRLTPAWALVYHRQAKTHVVFMPDHVTGAGRRRSSPGDAQPSPHTYDQRRSSAGVSRSCSGPRSGCQPSFGGGIIVSSRAGALLTVASGGSE